MQTRTYACIGMRAFMHSPSSSIHQGHCNFFFFFDCVYSSSSSPCSFTRLLRLSLSFSPIVCGSSLVYVSTQRRQRQRDKRSRFNELANFITNCNQNVRQTLDNNNSNNNSNFSKQLHRSCRYTHTYTCICERCLLSSA